MRIELRLREVGPNAPLGSFDSPVDASIGLSGAFAVTGWALDDIGVTRVRLYRNAVGAEGAGEVYIGDATFVRGARPHVVERFFGLT